MMARKRQRSSSDGGKKKQLMELPVDTLVDILSRLPAKSVGRIKCVSKTLLNLVNNISFSALHTRSLIATNSAAAADQVPRLMCCSRGNALLTLHSLKYEDNALTKGRYAITISSSTPRFMLFVFCNVLCLGNKNGDCMLVNGLGERGVLRLPEASFARTENGPNVYRYSRFGMGFDDKTNTYKIVCVTHERDADQLLKYSMTAHVHVLGTNSWRQISSLPPSELSWMQREPVCANGAVHWWTKGTLTLCDADRRIVSFDMRREQFSWTPTPSTLQSKNTLVGWNMFTLRGSLAIVETKGSQTASGDMLRKMEIWALKDFDDKQWVRYYYNNNILDDFPLEMFCGSPGEWEHGIFFTGGHIWEPCVFFIDLRSFSINRVIYSGYKVDVYREGYTSYCTTLLIGMNSYSEALISLKDYGDLEEAHEVIT